MEKNADVESIMKKDVNVEKLIGRFVDMAKRGTLLTGNVSQEDLLTQIVGTIAIEVITEERAAKADDNGGFES